MLKNYFKIAWRNLLKNKLYSFINIVGLAIGMAACFFIFQYVYFEKSYDKFNKNISDLYRVTISYSGSFSNLPTMATNHPAVGPAMQADFPEVRDFARLVSPSLFVSATTVSYTNKSLVTTTFNEPKMYLADGNFLKLFSYPFIKGNAATALNAPNTIALSASTAKKYFGNEDPMGKTLHLNQKIPVTVNGVFADVPENSHLKFDILIALGGLDNNGSLSSNWTWPEFYNYVLLAPGTDPQKIEKKFPAFIEKHLGSVMKEFSFGCAFHLQPVRDIHLKSAYVKEAEVNGSESQVGFLSIIGLIILTIAWINYVNLSTAKSLERAKEIGIRKVAGGTKRQLIWQFMIESAVINLLSLLVAFIIVLCCFPFFSAFAGKNMFTGTALAAIWRNAWFWPVLAVIFTSGVFLVGVYPAFVLSAFKPVLVLKGSFNRSDRGIALRKFLVSLQFILSILLIGGAITVAAQLSFMRNQSLGYNKDQVVIVKAPAFLDSSYYNKIALFETSLTKNPAVQHVTASSDIPGGTLIAKNSIRKLGDDPSRNFITYLMEIDDHFAQTYGITMAAGRSFRISDTIGMHMTKDEFANVIINESLARGLGFKTNEAALNQKLDFGMKCEVIGVMKDYHQRSLKEAYDPIIYYFASRSRDYSYFSINITTKNFRHDFSSVEKLYKEIFPAHPFEYFFLNDYFEQQYNADEQFGKVFTAFTILAIFVACLGLVGLSSFAISLRTKEIGIRKVLGASVTSIIFLFSKNFVQLVVLATVIAVPLIYFLADRWLMNYAFHTQLNLFIFLLPPFLLLVLTLLIVTLQGMGTATTNPVKSLRNE